MYLRTRDYDRFIQGANFQQIISQDSSLRLLAEAAALEEVNSNLLNKYDTSIEFTDTNPFSVTAAYNAFGRVELNGFADYNPAVSYLAANKTIVTFSSNIYIIKNDTTGVFAPGDWTLLGAQYDLFYIPYPYPVFSFYGTYKVGDRVFWKGNIYQCLQGTGAIDHQTFLNATTYGNIPPVNVFPDDSINGAQVWGNGVSYSVTGLNTSAVPADFTAWNNVTIYAIGDRVSRGNKIWEALAINTDKIPGIDITNWQSISWTLGDNRSQQLVVVMVDIVLYHLHTRIAPQNIPELRVLRYRSAQRWLNDANKGNITPNLPLTTPRAGGRIAFGGNTKLNNIY